MLKSRIRISRLLLFSIIIAIVVSSTTMTAEAGIIDELFSISFYKFHYVDEKGRGQTETIYNWDSEDSEKNGIKIEVIDNNKVRLSVDTSNELYQKCKPTLVWVHMGDALLDATRYTDLNLWYQNKLTKATYMLIRIPEENGKFTVDMDIPLKMNVGNTGILYGGYYETEFYSEDVIPEQLMYACEAKTYTVDELEEKLDITISEEISDFYNIDTGFRSKPNGVPFRNTDYPGKGGKCAGITVISTAKFNGYNLPTQFETSKGEYSIDQNYTWYNAVYGEDNLYDLDLENDEFLIKNSSEGNYYPRQMFDETYQNDDAFYQLLFSLQSDGNKAIVLGGNSNVLGFNLRNLQDYWTIIDNVASYLRSGKVLGVSLCNDTGGHTIVGYRMEQIDEDTYRLYCYDSNYPADKIPMASSEYKDEYDLYELDENGVYKYIDWVESDIYIDFNKETKLYRRGTVWQKEVEVFTFDATHTSHPLTSENGMITFSMYNENDVKVIKYGTRAKEVKEYKAYPIIKDDSTVEIRTFAFYKDGSAEEITNEINTTVKMNYNYIDWYKIKDSKITLTKNGYKFDNSGEQFIECIVSYNDKKDNYSQIPVRIPVGK